MTIRVFNTLTRQKEDFDPLTPGKVGVYVCGPTVYAPSHIGHMVGPVIFDAIKRYLAYSGFDVTLVINITDIDDKIIAQAANQGRSVEELAADVTDDYKSCLARLGVQVDQYPHATKHIPEMLEMISGLIDKGHAYESGGDVYFDVTTDDDYGKLSNRKIDELLAGVRKDVSDLKRNPGDFALWKAAKPGEPSWESPWGPGRPGWHIECSAMSMKYLGNTFDIHGGGLDLCFPHHEAEIAQSECFTGQPFAKYWMHNGLMQRSDATKKIGAREGDFASQEEDKMSKSKDNVITIAGLLDRFEPETIRFFLLSTHYRRPIDFSDERIVEVEKGLDRLRSFAERASRILGESFYDLSAPAERTDLPFEQNGCKLLHEVAEMRRRFLEHMDDDFNTAGALGVLFERLGMLNRFIDDHELEGADASARDVFREAAGVVKELTQVLGILTQPPIETQAEGLTPALLDMLLEIRQTLRKEKNFALADLIRDRLTELDVAVEDGADGSRWKIGGG